MNKWTMRKHFFLRGINKTGASKQPKKCVSNFYLYLSIRGMEWQTRRGREVTGRNILGKASKLKLIRHLRLIKVKEQWHIARSNFNLFVSPNRLKKNNSLNKCLNLRYTSVKFRSNQSSLMCSYRVKVTRMWTRVRVSQQPRNLWHVENLLVRKYIPKNHRKLTAYQ